jgi:4-hydroxybenzoate polyprenyltransferase
VLVVFAGVESRNVEDADGDSRLRRETVASLLGPGRARALVVLLKLSAAGVFWLVGGPLSVALLVCYLGYLRVCRGLTRTASLGQ